VPGAGAQPGGGGHRGTLSSNLPIRIEPPRLHRRTTSGPKFDSGRLPPYTRAVEQWIPEAFLEAVRQVLSETGVSVDSVGAGESPAATEGIIATVGFAGDLRGVFTLHADLASAGGLLQAMTGGLEILLDDSHEDLMRMEAFGELANQVSGRAMTILYERKLRCDITPPAIFSGRDLRSPAFGPGKSTGRVLRGPFGRLALFLGVQELRGVEQLEKTS
jgi:CheY-specific phosphatase CheX